MAKNQVVKEARKSTKYEVHEELGKYQDYRAAELVAANQREAGRIARAVRKVVYMVEIKPRVIY